MREHAHGCTQHAWVCTLKLVYHSTPVGVKDLYCQSSSSVLSEFTDAQATLPASFQGLSCLHLPLSLEGWEYKLKLLHPAWQMYWVSKSRSSPLHSKPYTSWLLRSIFDLGSCALSIFNPSPLCPGHPPSLVSFLSQIVSFTALSYMWYMYIGLKLMCVCVCVCVYSHFLSFLFW